MTYTFVYVRSIAQPHIYVRSIAQAPEHNFLVIYPSAFYMTTYSQMGGARTHAKSIEFASEDTTKNQWNKCGNISIKMLKDVGITVPKSRETSAVYPRYI